VPAAYYEVLGVAKDAKGPEIKKAYYKMARQYHPDTSDDPASEEIFKIVNEAYHVLIDDTKRAAYDRYGRDGVAQTEGGGPDPVEMMKAMFGGDAFSDTFGELNMWETIRLQMMMANGASMTEEEATTRLQNFAKERDAKLVQQLLEKTAPFVKDDVGKFKEVIDGDLEQKVAAPGGLALLGAIGYVYCQVREQRNDSFSQLLSFVCRWRSSTWTSFWGLVRFSPRWRKRGIASRTTCRRWERR
jgi:curved DNA-binding protein CbpA